MLTIITNYLLANRLLDYIEEEYETVAINKSAFYWGTQGFNFLEIATEENLIDFKKNIFINNSQQTLNFLTNFAKGSNNPIEIGYTLGFFAYYSLEKIALPFIKSGAKQLTEYKNLQSLLDSEIELSAILDTISYRYDTGNMPNKINLKICAPLDEDVISHISLFYSILGKDILKTQINVEQISKYAHIFYKNNKSLNDPFGFKRDFAIRKERLHPYANKKSLAYRPLTENDDIDYANVSNNEWILGSTTKTDSFLELFEQSSTMAYAMVDGYFL